jgi:hypothetical protein
MVSVEGLPLSDGTVVYYFTYGSVLSGLHREGDDKCDKAMAIFDQLRARYADDPTIMSIVRAGEEVCTYTAEPTETTPAEPIGTSPVITPTEVESSP